MDSPTASSAPVNAGRRSIGRQSLHGEVANHIRDMITTGELAPGTRISEGDLCRQFEISRTPLREALKVLASEGLVSLRPHRGTFVSEISDEEVTALFEVVGGLERLAAELAAERMSEMDLDELRMLHDRMELCHSARERGDYFRVNQQIHDQIVRLAGNAVLESTHASLMTRVRRVRYLAIQSQERWNESVDEHRAILDALAVRDGCRAGTLIQAHVRKTGALGRGSIGGSLP
ncbi:MAG: GntR family transcriptional regulator [Rhodospirillales bacterium]|jgi:DNA-binding GntR family transcriptional regulator|nr:GntR family transcriptional regulator [Rhodospirillales bacterium]